MKDKLEKFLARNRDSFDTEVPSDHVWDRVESNLKRRISKAAPHYGWIWKAAAIFFLGLSTYLLIDRTTPTETLEAEMTLVGDGFIETETYYVSLIEQKRQEIEHLDIPESKVKQEFEVDINELGAYYEELREELKLTGNQKVLDAMIDNLKLRMELLNRELEILQKLKTYHHEHSS